MASSKMSDYIKPSDRQKEAFKHIGQGGMVFYGGARGGGKSWLAFASAMYTAISNPGITVTIVRETYPELYDVFISKQNILFPPSIFQYNYRERYKELAFTNGSRIIYRAIDSIKNAKKMQGAEAQYLIIDEAPNIPLSILRLLWGSVRKSKRLPDFKPTVLMTGNPGGVSDYWFKTHYIDLDMTQWEPNEIHQADRFIFIPAKVQDNIYIDQEAYINNLLLQGEDKRRAWLEGDWNVFEGQFFTEWNPEVHIVAPFNIPDHWMRVVGFDLGYTAEHPTVGEWITQDPDTLDLYVYKEYAAYGVVEQYVTDISEMRDYNEDFIIFGDPSMFDNSRKNQFQDVSPAQMFLNNGLAIVPANNDRINGWRMLKQWLHWTPKRPPKLRIFDTCTQLIKTIPTLKYNTTMRTDLKREDLDTRMADDAVDALRYGIISAFGFPVVEGMEDIHPDLQKIVKAELTLPNSNKPHPLYNEAASAKKIFGNKPRKSYYANY